MNVEFPLGQWSGIAIYDDGVDKAACQNIIDLVERHWIRLEEMQVLNPGKMVGGVDQSIKNSTDMNISAAMGDELYSMGGGWSEQDMHAGLVKCVNHYVNQYPGLSQQCFPLQDMGYQFQKYDVGYGKYDEHIDGGPFGRSFDRMLAVIVYLNDVDEGGETTFTRQELSVKPVAGRVLIFPCHWLYPHRGEISFDKDKYIITTFVMQEDMNHLIQRPDDLQDHFHDHFHEEDLANYHGPDHHHHDHDHHHEGEV